MTADNKLMNDVEKFWERLNDLIKKSNTTQRELSEECGFSPRRIQNLSAGNRLLDSFEVVAVAKALNTTVEYLVTGYEPGYTDEISELNFDSNFYDRVKELVKQRQIPLLSFLQSLNINYDTYKSAKRLNNYPRVNEVVVIAKALNTTVEYLVTGEHNGADKELRELKHKLLEFAQSVQ